MYTNNICPFNTLVFFTTKQVFFLQTSQMLFMFQCNEHVEMNKFCVQVSLLVLVALLPKKNLLSIQMDDYKTTNLFCQNITIHSWNK